MGAGGYGFGTHTLRCLWELSTKGLSATTRKVRNKYLRQIGKEVLSDNMDIPTWPFQQLPSNSSA